MSKVKVKRIKIPAGMKDEGLAEMFNQMLGAENANLTIAYPRYVRIKGLCENLIRIFEMLANSPFMRSMTEFAREREQIIKFCEQGRAEIKELFCMDFSDYEWNLTLVESELQKKFTILYESMKVSHIVNNFINIVDRLHSFRKNFEDINNMNHKFINTMPGVEWYPFPFTTLNIKYIFSLSNIGSNTIAFFMTIFNKTYEYSRKVYDEVQSPNIDIDQFITIIMSNIDEIQKRPELSRCKKAFEKIKHSVGLLKTNFNNYYRDFIDTKDSTIIMQHFILDVGKTTEADAQVTQQFRTIISYYRKIAQNQITNPKIKMLFDKANESFQKLERGTENLVKIRHGDDSDSEQSEDADSEPIRFMTQAISAAEIREDSTEKK